MTRSGSGCGYRGALRQGRESIAWILEREPPQAADSAIPPRLHSTPVARVRCCGSLRIMITPHGIRILVVVLLMIAAGCGPEYHEKALGSIDLSAKGSKCESRFRWNSHGVGLQLLFSDTNGVGKPAGANPDWPLVMQLEVFNGAKLVTNTPITREQMVFADCTAPETCLLLRTPEGFDGSLRAGHSYKFVLTVTQGEKSLGPAKVSMCWITGGDSL